MYPFHSLKFHNQEKNKDMEFQSQILMDYNIGNNFLYGLWNGPIIYNVAVRDLISNI